MFGSYLDQWSPLLRKQVDGLVGGLKMTDSLEKVYLSEKHAQQLDNDAHSLHRCVCVCVRVCESVWWSYLSFLPQLAAVCV